MQKEYTDTINTLKKGLSELEDLKKKIADVNSDTSEKIADRYLEIGERIQDAKDKLAEFNRQQVEYANAVGKDVLNNMDPSQELML